MFDSYKISGSCRSELNTELRFLFASAKVDGEELIRLALTHTEDEREDARVNGCVIKVLRTLKKENVIQFYVNGEGFATGSTEASFLLNKYGDYIKDNYDKSSSIYVKL